MRRKLLITLGVLCILALACLPLIFGPLDPLEEKEFRMKYNPSTNCLEFYRPDGTMERYSMPDYSWVHYDGAAPDSHGVKPELFFSTFFQDPLRLKPDNNATIGDDNIYIFSTDSSRLYSICLIRMGVNEEHLVLEFPTGEIYVSTDRRFTEEKLRELFDR